MGKISKNTHDINPFMSSSIQIKMTVKNVEAEFYSRIKNLGKDLGLHETEIYLDLVRLAIEDLLESRTEKDAGSNELSMINVPDPFHQSQQEWGPFMSQPEKILVPFQEVLASPSTWKAFQREFLATRISEYEASLSQILFDAFLGVIGDEALNLFMSTKAEFNAILPLDDTEICRVLQLPLPALNLYVKETLIPKLKSFQESLAKKALEMAGLLSAPGMDPPAGLNTSQPTPHAGSDLEGEKTPDDREREIQILKNEQRVLTEKVVHLSRKAKWKGPSKEELQIVADCSRKKNGTISYRKAGKKMGVNHTTAKRRFDLSGIK